MEHFEVAPTSLPDGSHLRVTALSAGSCIGAANWLICLAPPDNHGAGRGDLGASDDPTRAVAAPLLFWANCSSPATALANALPTQAGLWNAAPRDVASVLRAMRAAAASLRPEETEQGAALPGAGMPVLVAACNGTGGMLASCGAPSTAPSAPHDARTGGGEATPARGPPLAGGSGGARGARVARGGARRRARGACCGSSAAPW